MHVEIDVQAMHELAERARCRGDCVGLVPTMGALHEGHFELVRKAEKACDWIVVSSFVNPTQFGPDEDLERYPRDVDADAEQLSAFDVDVLFTPTVAGMYPNADSSTWVQVDDLDQHLCGRFRPGHFRGVTTVVSKLMNIMCPHVAVFGQKDAQQLVMIRRLVSDLLLNVEILSIPIVREEDGLAMSSRNAYLSASEREQATVLYEAVNRAEAMITEGEQGVKAVVEAMKNELSGAPAANPEYAQVVDQRTLNPVEKLTQGQEVIAAVAVYFGDTRLIDNAFATVGSNSSGSRGISL